MSPPTTTLSIDRNGSWRQDRFKFCNMLEAALDGDKRARAELAAMGVRVAEAPVENTNSKAANT